METICKNAGEVYGRLTVIGEAPRDKSSHRRVHVVCVCGSEKVTLLYSLKSGHTSSCGCMQRDLLSKARRTHGMANSPEYSIWSNMWARCENLNNADYNEYKDRTPPNSWRDFATFYADMGPRPSLSHSIDRVRNGEPYGPDNCRWATITEQARNRLSNRLITFEGKTLTLVEWAEITGLGLSSSKISKRLRLGWSIEKTLTTPTQKKQQE